MAALDAEHLLAVSAGRLYVAREGRWHARSLGGAVVRDVAAARGGLYALARGMDAQSAMMMVLRVRDGEISLLDGLARPEGFEPTRLSMARGEQSIFIGGDGAPWGVRVRWGTEVTPLEGASGPVRALRYTGDEVLLVRSDAGVRALRWGEWNRLPEGFVTMVADVPATTLVMRDGSVEQGFPWVRAGVRTLHGPSGIEPIDAVIADGHMVEVSAEGRTTVLQGATWREVGQVPEGPVVALFGGHEALAVTSRGAVHALRDGGWVPCVTAMDAGEEPVR